MTAWSAKVFSSSISLSENGPGSARATAMTPMGAPSRSIGTPEAAAKADRAGQSLMLPFRIELDIRNVDKRALEDRPSRQEGPGWARRIYAVKLLEGFGGVVVMGDQMEQLAVELKERAEESIAQPARRF